MCGSRKDISMNRNEYTQGNHCGIQYKADGKWLMTVIFPKENKEHEAIKAKIQECKAYGFETRVVEVDDTNIQTF
tara:strand:+ start:1478 stop:1702 length:225 start_codon:yes stop_codon:yes gene_type:complete